MLSIHRLNKHIFESVAIRCKCLYRNWGFRLLLLSLCVVVHSFPQGLASLYILWAETLTGNLMDNILGVARPVSWTYDIVCFFFFFFAAIDHGGALNLYTFYSTTLAENLKAPVLLCWTTSMCSCSIICSSFNSGSVQKKHPNNISIYPVKIICRFAVST